jgi:hypothetical protein
MRFRLFSSLLALGLLTVSGLAIPAPAPTSAPAPGSAQTPGPTPAPAPAAVAPATVNPPLTDLVDDQTAIAVVVFDTPALLRGWDASPFARTWNDEQVVKFLAPLRALMKIDNWDDQARAATGKTVRELLALAKGQILIALPASAIGDHLGGPVPAGGAASEGGAPPLPALIAVELGENADVVEKLAAEAGAKNENLRVETTNYAGVLVHTSLEPAPKEGGKPGTPMVTAMCQGDWLLSPSYDQVCAAIDAIKKGGLANALGRSEPFLRARERAGNAQLIGFGNCPAIYPVLLAVAKKQLAAGAPFTPEALLNGLGLDTWRELFYALNFGEQETRQTVGLGWSEERGLTKLLAFGPGAAVRPDWTPARWINVNASKFDLRATYAALLEMLGAISPALLTDAQGEIKGMGEQMGIDLQRDLIGSLGADVVMATALPADADPAKPPAPDQLDQLYAIALDNPAAFTKAVEGVKGMVFGPAAGQVFTKRDYLGQVLYTFTPPTEPGAPPEADSSRSFTYAIADHTLLLGVGSPAPVEAALQGMAEKRGSFWDKAEVKAALANVPEEANSVQVTDLRVLVAGLIEMLSNIPPGLLSPPTVLSGPPGPVDPPAVLVDPTAKPDPDRLARYWGLSSGYLEKDAKGIFSVSRIANPQP